MIEQIIRETASQGWSYVDKFIPAETLTSLNQFFDQHQTEFTPAQVGKGADQSRREEIRGDYSYWLDPLSPPPEIQPLITFLNKLKLKLNQSLFLGIKDFECHLAYYPKGSFYKMHLDRHEQGSSRIFSFVFYLHREWQKGDGGELELFHKDYSPFKTIEPRAGSFICFLSEDFPHEVKLSNKERRSLTGWMHNKILH